MEEEFVVQQAIEKKLKDEHVVEKKNFKDVEDRLTVRMECLAKLQEIVSQVKGKLEEEKKTSKLHEKSLKEEVDSSRSQIQELEN